MSKKILVVDDEEGIRFTFKEMLRQEGYTVSTAKDYNDAMASLSKAVPDLIIADLILGGRTGIDLVKEARNRGIRCPVIMITGGPSEATAEEAARHGVVNYLAKPVLRDVLLGSVAKALQQDSQG